VTPAGFDYASVVNAANPDEGVGTYEKTNAGYIGDGYYNFNNEAGSSATWKLNVSKAGESQIAIRFANGGNANRDMTLVVNGKEVGTVVFPSTGAWTTYEVAVVDGAVALNAGANTVQLVSVSAEGGPNVDAFGFSLAGVAQGSSTESTTAQPKVVALNNSFDAISGTIRVAEAGIAEIYVYDVTGHMVTGLSKMVSEATALGRENQARRIFRVSAATLPWGSLGVSSLGRVLVFDKGLDIWESSLVEFGKARWLRQCSFRLPFGRR